MHPSDLSCGEAELLERHALTRSDEAVNPALERFRVEHAALVRITDRVLALLRVQLRGATDTERSLAAMKQYLAQPQADLSPSGGRMRIPGLVSPARQRRVWYAFGAVVTGVALLVTGWSLGRTGRRPRASEATYTTYATTNGQRAKITLPDGNTVALGVASRLEVPTNYSAGNHAVRLPVGEALFTVSHRPGRSFSVVVGSTAVHVLGTSFVVRHYATDTATVVAVRDGKVGIRSVVLTAAQQVAVDPAGRVGPVQPADSAQFSFANGMLMLTGGLFSNAIPELDRWYDADIRIHDSTLATRRLTGEYEAGSLADLASILEMTFDVRVVRQGRVLTLYPR